MRLDTGGGSPPEAAPVICSRDAARRLRHKCVAVVGCGIFGALCAIRLAEAGAQVVVFERRKEPLAGATHHNLRRVHLGHHYPRDAETARQCIRGFRRFCDEFPKSIVALEVSAYFVASFGSLTSPGEYLRHADALGVDYAKLDLRAFRPVVQNVDVGIAVPEVVYDAGILREEVRGRLAGVDCRYGCEASRIERRGAGFLLDGEHFDAVVNCTYADINRLGAQLGHALPEWQYEYVVIPIVEWRQPPVGITIMDGPFSSVLPHGRTGNFLFYHVEHSVVDRAVARQMPAALGRPERLGGGRPEALCGVHEKILGATAEFVPDIRQARLIGFLEGPRVVLPDSDSTDRRPSIVACPEPNYLTVFAGKVDHAPRAADEVVARLELKW